MNQDETHKMPLGEIIVETLKKGDVVMRPKWYFVLHLCLLIVGTILAALTLLFIVSFIVFSLRQNGSWFTAGFGAPGWRVLLTSLPWLLIILGLIFTAIVGLLVRKYSFAYGRPLLYSAIGIIAIAGIGGFLIALTPFHSGLFGQAEERRLPLAGGMYRQFAHQQPDNVVVGKIIEKLPDGFGLHSQDNELLVIQITPRTKLPPQPLRLEEVVVVLGERKGAVIEALGIKPIGPRPGRRPMK